MQAIRYSDCSILQTMNNFDVKIQPPCRDVKKKSRRFPANDVKKFHRFLSKMAETVLYWTQEPNKLQNLNWHFRKKIFYIRIKDLWFILNQAKEFESSSSI